MTAILVVIAVVAFLVFGFIISYFIINEMLFSRFFGKAPKDIRQKCLTDEHYKPVKEKIISAAERLEKCAKKTYTLKSFDGLTLYGDLYGGGSDTLIIMAHGLHSVPSYNFGILAMQALDFGYDLLLIDQRAHGRSGGKYASYGLKESKDILSWIDFAAKTFPHKNVFLHGVSMGAAAIGFASDKITDASVKGGIMDCGFISAYSVADHIIKTRRLPGFIFFRYLRIRAKLTIGLGMKKDKVTDYIKNSKIPILFIHGEKDDVAPISGAKELFRVCGAEKELVTVSGAGHTTASVIGKEEVAEKYFGFIEKYKTK